MNLTSNCFRIYGIPQIWPLATFSCYQISKEYSLNEEVIPETEVYFEEMEKSYYKNGFEKLEGRYKHLKLDTNVWEECTNKIKQKKSKFDCT